MQILTSEHTLESHPDKCNAYNSMWTGAGKVVTKITRTHHKDVIVLWNLAAVAKQFEQVKELTVNVAAHSRRRIDWLHV